MSLTIYTRVKCPAEDCGATVPIIENLGLLGAHMKGLNPDDGMAPGGTMCPNSFKDINDFEPPLEVVTPRQEVK